MIKTTLESYPDTSPERDLWCSVLDLAISDYGKRKRLDELDLFFFGGNENGRHFEWICSLIDIDPDGIRSRLRREYQ